MHHTQPAAFCSGSAGSPKISALLFPAVAAAGAAADVYLVCNLSCVDLPTLEEYVQEVSGCQCSAAVLIQLPQLSWPTRNCHKWLTDPAATAAAVELMCYVYAPPLPLQVAKGKPVVTWNIELDTHRGDLGLVSFPPKELHYRYRHRCPPSSPSSPALHTQPVSVWPPPKVFTAAASRADRQQLISRSAHVVVPGACRRFLSKLRPVFFLRPRDYSKSVAVAPFIINYSGALFREYPGPWQVRKRITAS